VVSDEALPAAVRALEAAVFPSCSQGRQCNYAHDTVQWRGSPPPSAHFHLSAHTFVTIFERSKTLISVNDLTNSSKIIRASDRNYLPEEEPGMGAGVFDETLPAVNVPSADCLVETYCHLLLPDWGASYGSFWLSMLAYVMQYVDERGRLDLDKVESRCRKFYLDVKAGQIGAKQAMKDFRKVMES
jgi:hypothetical protein